MEGVYVIAITGKNANLKISKLKDEGSFNEWHFVPNRKYRIDIKVNEENELVYRIQGNVYDYEQKAEEASKLFPDLEIVYIAMEQWHEGHLPNRGNEKFCKYSNGTRIECTPKEVEQYIDYIADAGV